MSKKEAPEKQIERIREEYMGLKDKPRKSLKNSIHELAEGLNSKETHFVFELVQNAEDNRYAPDVAPKFSIETARMTIGGNLMCVVIVRNNEIGFEPEQVDALCQVGESTKKKSEGYIGEKGIGFKSVFKVTDCPHIISNGFQFCLPKDDEKSGLGYIVPTWLKSVPSHINPNETTIILPLQLDKIFDVTQALSNIAPETILFLKKLKKIIIKNTLPNSKHINIIIEKDIDEKSTRSSVITLRFRGEIDDEQQERVYRYWLYCKPYEKPHDIEHAKRKGIESREVSVAIPLDENTPAEKLFAYLPVWENTGLPFIINADFLLVSSREGILEDEKWNLWLRDCISDAFCNAFNELVHDNNLSCEEKYYAYASIPTVAHQDFLKTVIQQIQIGLTDTECILVQPDNHTVIPYHAKIPSQGFQYLISSAKSFPNTLSSKIYLVSIQIQHYRKRLESIGVKLLDVSDEYICFEEEKWLKKQTLDWIVDLYKHLYNTRNAYVSKSLDLSKLKIVPVNKPGYKYRLSCDIEQPIYFPLSNESNKLLANAPNYFRKKINLAFISDILYKKLSDLDIYDNIKNFLIDNLKIYEFSLLNYIVDIINFISLSRNPNEIVNATTFILNNINDSQPVDELPIVLNDNSILSLSDAREPIHGSYSGQIVVPENYDPKKGWQKIWKKENRGHFHVLSNTYSNSCIKRMLELEVIREFPMPYWYKYSDTPISVEHIEEDYWFPNELSIPMVPALLRFLNTMSDIQEFWPFNPNEWFFTGKKHRIEWAYKRLYYLQHGQPYMNSGQYHFKCDLSSFAETLIKQSWLPTTKGNVRPSTAFLPKSEIKEILGDTVPYFEDSLPEKIVNFLGIQTAVTSEVLINYLDNLKKDGNNVHLPLVSTVYREIAHRKGYSCGSEFRNRNLICIKSDEGNVEWYSPDDCIWEDARNALSDSFVYLECHYPKLKTFFVDLLGVKEWVDPETYAERWLQYQEEPDEEKNKRQSVMENLYKGLRASIVSESDNDDYKAYWKDPFLKSVKVYTQQGSFQVPSDVVLPDDERLRTLFADGNIEYAWRPPKDSFNDWRAFYQRLGVPLLSESVKEEMCGSLTDNKTKAINRYLTSEAVLMIAAWLREKHNDDHEYLLESGGYEQLFMLREVETESAIQVKYTLKTGTSSEERELETNVYWEKNQIENLLLHTRKFDKTDFALCIAKMIITKRHYKDLADFIELCLEEKDTRRLKSKGWNVPQEVLDLKKKIDAGEALLETKVEEENEEPIETDDESEGSTAIEMLTLPVSSTASNYADNQTTHTKRPFEESAEESITKTSDVKRRCKIQTSYDGAQDSDRSTRDDDGNENSGIDPSIDEGDGERFNYGMMFEECFNRTGASDFEGDAEEYDYYHGKNTIVKDPNRRLSRERTQHNERINNEPNAEERRRKTISTLLESPDPQVRAKLYEWYQGRCQICGDTFPDCHGEPFFIAAYLVERKHKGYVDTVGNALCLCADHFVKWRHAAKESVNIREQVSRVDLTNTNEDVISLHFKMFGKDHRIEYYSRHFLSLKALLDVTDSTLP